MCSSSGVSSAGAVFVFDGFVRSGIVIFVATLVGGAIFIAEIKFSRLIFIISVRSGSVWIGVACVGVSVGDFSLTADDVERDGGRAGGGGTGVGVSVGGGRVSAGGEEERR